MQATADHGAKSDDGKGKEPAIPVTVGKGKEPALFLPGLNDKSGGNGGDSEDEDEGSDEDEDEDLVAQDLDMDLS